MAIIDLDSEIAKEFGFTSNKFNGWLWQIDNAIYISFIETLNPGRGHFSNLINTILTKGYIVKVPTPLSRMQSILEHLKFTKSVEDLEGESCEVWIKEPNK